MSVNRLGQRLARDLKKSPKKSLALAVLALVAAWFWAPLLGGWFKTEEAAKTTEAVAGDVTTTPEAEGESLVRPAWRELTERVRKDERMRSAAAVELRLAPEVAAASVAAEPAATTSAANDRAETISPAAAGLTLSATLVGPSRGVAVINGRPYREGSSVKVADDLAFVVSRVKHKSAVLSRKGVDFILSTAQDRETAGLMIGPSEVD